MRLRLFILALAVLVCSSCSDVRDSEGKTALYRAAESGDLQHVREQVEMGADLNSRNAYPEDTAFLVRWLPGTRHLAGRSPLHAAAENRHVDVVKYLIVNGADVNVRDRQAQTALALVAAAHGDMAIAELLIEAGADVDTVDARGVTPLIHAAQLGNSELVRYFASRGALVDRVTRDGRTALHFVAENGSAAIASVLLDEGADPNLSLDNEQPPLQLAVLNGHDEVVRELLEAGADPDRIAPGTTPLLVNAAYEGRSDMVELLLEHGAAADAVSSGYTAAHHAAAKGYAEILLALVLCGADLERTDGDGARTPLQIAVEADHLEAVRVLLEGGADPNAAAASHSPPLTRAARLGNLDIVKLLLLNGADVNAKDGEWTALRFAEYGNHPAVADYLRQQGGTY